MVLDCMSCKCVLLVTEKTFLNNLIQKSVLGKKLGFVILLAIGKVVRGCSEAKNPGCAVFTRR